MNSKISHLLIGLVGIGVGWLWRSQTVPIDKVAAPAEAADSLASGSRKPALESGDSVREAGDHESAAVADAHSGNQTFEEQLDVACKLGRPFMDGAIIALLAKMKPKDALQTYAYLQKITTSQDGSASAGKFWQAFWMSWSKTDPIAAFNHAQQELPVYPGSDQLMKHIFEGIAIKDVNKALELYGTLTNHSDLSWAAEGLTVRWAETDAAAATKWGLELTDPELKDKALRAIPYGILLKQGMAAANLWWQGISDPKTQARAFDTAAHAASFISEHLPDASAGWQFMEDGMAKGYRNARLETTVAMDFGQTNPTQGVAQFSQWPAIDGQVGNPNISTILSTWTKRDPTAASQWLTDQAGQPWRDSAVLGLATALRNENPAAADKWLATITDPAIRSKWGK